MMSSTLAPSLLFLLENLQTPATQALPALIEPKAGGYQTLTYGQLWQQVKALAWGLKTHFNMAPNDKIALLFANQSEFLIGLLAARFLGAVPVPVNLAMTPEDTVYVLKHAQPKAILASAEVAMQLAPAVMSGTLQLPPVLIAGAEGDFPLPLPKWEDWLAEAKEHEAEIAALQAIDTDTKALGLLMYTSGTTGNPKGVMLSEFNLLSNLQAFGSQLGLPAGHKMLLGLPLFHAYGLICALYGLVLKAPLVLVPKFQPKAMLEAVLSQQVTILPLVPTMFSLLCQQAQKLGPKPFEALEICISGGAALAPDLLRRVEETLEVTVLEGYGLTETSPVIAVNTLAQGSMPGTVGPVLQNINLRLVNEQGEVLETNMGVPSEEGEIEVQGPNVMLGYYLDETATAEVLSPHGWLKTGDLGHLDAAGNLVISGGRKKDLIIKAGENIAPVKIEAVLHQHPAVAAVAVLGLPDARLGEAIVACLELHPMQEETFETYQKRIEQELKALCQAQLPAFYHPNHYSVEADLPKTPAGKVVKKQLKAQLLSRAQVSASV